MQHLEVAHKSSQRAKAILETLAKRAERGASNSSEAGPQVASSHSSEPVGGAGDSGGGGSPDPTALHMNTMINTQD